MISSVAHSTRSVGVFRRGSSRLLCLKSPTASVVGRRATGAVSATNRAQIVSAPSIRRGVASLSLSTPSPLVFSTTAAFSSRRNRQLTGKSTMAPRASTSPSNSPSSTPGRPLKLPPVPWILAVAFGLGWLTLLAFAPSALPAGMKEFALDVLSVANLGTIEGAKSVATVAWGIHVLEGLYAAKVVSDAGGDAGAAVWWGGWSFLVGFPAVLMAKGSVGEGSKRE